MDLDTLLDNSSTYQRWKHYTTLCTFLNYDLSRSSTNIKILMHIWTHADTKGSHANENNKSTVLPLLKYTL